MKKTKRMHALLLSVILTLALGTTAFAAGNDTYTITVKGDKVVPDHTYEAYQVFKGKLSTDGNTLSDIDWGTGVNGTALLSALKESTAFNTTTGEEEEAVTKNDFEDCENAEDVAEVLATYGNDAEKTQAFAKLAGANLTKTCVTSNAYDSENKQYTITGLTPGYYLVKDKNDSDLSNDAYTRYILKVINNVQVNAKVDVPSIKKVIDEGEGLKANTANIGDNIPYKITSAVPDMTGYIKYFYVLNDTMSKGLTFNNVVSITIGTKKLAATDFIVKSVGNQDGSTSIQIAIKNFINYKDQKNAAITIEYSATLNQDANLTQTGNINEVTLTYSNNPNITPKGDPDTPDIPHKDDVTGITPISKTKTYATGIKLIKVDAKDKTKTLTGAKFSIAGEGMKVVLINKEIFKVSDKGTYYMLKDGTYTAEEPDDDTEASYDSTSTMYEKVTVVDKETVPTSINAIGYVDSKGVLTLEGLAAGTYTLTELIAPDGYNKLAQPIEVVIGADATIDSCTWTATVDSKEADYSDNHVNIRVENNAGSILPSTGGMGTKIIYVLGSLLVVTAIVLLITKKRMASKN